MKAFQLFVLLVCMVIGGGGVFASTLSSFSLVLIPSKTVASPGEMITLTARIVNFTGVAQGTPVVKIQGAPTVYNGNMNVEGYQITLAFPQDATSKTYKATATATFFYTDAAI